MISGDNIVSSWDVIMENGKKDSVSEFIEGENEPAASWILFILGFVITIIFLVLYGVLFPGSDLPVVSTILPIFEGVFDSGLWFFILGIMIGAFAILGTMLTEATSE